MYSATQKLLDDSFTDANSPFPTRMREKPELYEVGPINLMLQCHRVREVQDW